MMMYPSGLPSSSIVSLYSFIGTKFILLIQFCFVGVTLPGCTYSPIMQSTALTAICFFQAFSGLLRVIFTCVFLVVDRCSKNLGLLIQVKLSGIVSYSLS
uniref:Uncharacterized protein n=1 Tax=Euplotes harpa TaxID=151035 RepID=A0A7S3J790_9SPIT